MMLLLLLCTIFPVSPGESIQEAIDSSLPGDTILLLEGTHSGSGEHLFALDGEDNGKVILGDPSDPGSVILSGNGLDGSIGFIDGASQGPVDTTTVIAGVAFTDGEAGPEPFGGGIYTRHSSVLVHSSVFSGCSADNGGAIYSWKGAPVLRNILFTGNQCLSAGGAVYLYSSNARLEHCEFRNNTSWDDGGGVFCYHSSPEIFNCLFTEGYAHDDGGGIYCYALSDPQVSFCTFRNNFALYTGSAVYFRVNCSPLITHCIAVENQAPAFYIQDGGSPQFTYNCVWGNPDGNYGNLPDPTGSMGNISMDPLFTGDCFLSQTAAGQQYQSPCVDTGQFTSDHYGLEALWTRTDSIPDNLIADMGYHHGFGTGFQSGYEEGGSISHVISPNPASLSFNILLHEPSEWQKVEIFDLAGRLILEMTVEGSSMTVPTASLGATGIYCVRISGSTRSCSLPVCVIR